MRGGVVAYCCPKFVFKCLERTVSGTYTIASFPRQLLQDKGHERTASVTRQPG